jgi:hypothetical protein
MGARNQVIIGFSYQPARLHRLVESIPLHFHEGIKFKKGNWVAVANSAKTLELVNIGYKSNTLTFLIMTILDASSVICDPSEVQNRHTLSKIQQETYR